MTNSTFIQIPNDVTDPLSLKRFLSKLVLQLDIAFSNRGSGGFADSSYIKSTATSIQEVVADINNLSNSFVLLDSSNIKEPIQYPSDVVTSNGNDLVTKDYVDSLYNPTNSPADLPASATLDEVIIGYNNLLSALKSSKILI